MKIKQKPIIHQETPPILKCDFCSITNVICAFSAPDMTAGEYDAATDELDPVWTSVGQWAACDVCAQLLEQGKLDELAKRAMETCPGNAEFVREYPEAEPKMLALLKGQYEQINKRREAA